MTQTLFQDAKWILADCNIEEICDCYFEYSTEFEVAKEKKITLAICAYSQYAVYVNGTFVNCGQYDGYEDYQVYDTLDITEYVKEGRNELYIGQYVCGADFSTRRKQKPGIIFTIQSEQKPILSSNCTCLSRINKHFLNKKEKISAQLGYNFEYDATVTEDAYKPSVLAGKEKYLYSRPVEKLLLEPFAAATLCTQGVFLEHKNTNCKAERMQTAYLSTYRKETFCNVQKENIHWSVPKETDADGVYFVFDLQRECAGLLEFTVDVPEETEVLIGFGEHLQDLRVRSFIGGRNFCFRYMAKKGIQTFFYPYQRMGLRYLQFHVYSKSGILQAGIRLQKYPLTTYSMPIADRLYKHIYDVCVNTLEVCVHEHYEDCPWREQALYAMDSRVQMLCGYYAFREYALPRASLVLMARSLRKDKLLELCAPGLVPVNIPAFTAVFVREVLEYVQYANDLSLVEEIFPVLKEIVEGFAERIRENHLIPLYCGQEYWNFYEWTEGMAGRKRHVEDVFESPFNAFVSDAFRCFAKLCETVAPDLAETYRVLHQNMNLAIHEKFFDKEVKAYRTNENDEKPLHELTQGLLLYINAVPEQYKEAVAQSILSKKFISCSVSMTIYVYEALLSFGETYRAYVLQEIECIWGKMLLSGADTFWETEDGASAFSDAGSLCHGWSAVPVYLFGKYFIK